MLIRSIFIILCLYVIQAAADEYHVLKSEQNMVKFISDAPIEDFEGTTDKIDGYIFWAGTDLTDQSDLYFEVDLNTLDTGIGLRNRHMRENYLETDKYPLTHFKGKVIKSQNVSETEYNVQVQGKMFIHGVEQQKKVEGVLTFDGDKLLIMCTFDVKLSDYNIDIPSIMFYKIDETMQLELKFYLISIR